MGLGYGQLREAVAGGVVGFRSRVGLEPLAGAGAKVFPATYAPLSNARTRYATERRHSPDGAGVSEAVVLDSVSSQANRFELALLDAVRTGRVQLPVTAADFRGFGQVADLDRISDFEAPHRIFDALLRDSFDGEVLFRYGPTGRSITEASAKNAAAMFVHSPHTLVFGGWDSTGPRGGRGAKYERALVSEVVAHDVQYGVKTSSRIDPARIERAAGTVYEAADPLGWTLDPDQAVTDAKGQPVRYARGEGGERGRPSQVNHGNVVPSIDDTAGGITAGRIEATVVLSLIQLRRLRFPLDAEGNAFDANRSEQVQTAARAALAALGLAAAVLGFADGFDLRSRCVLVPTGPQVFELVRRADQVREFTLEPAEACALLAEAAAAAAEVGVAWRTEELLLTPSERLIELITRSRALPPEETSDSGVA